MTVFPRRPRRYFAIALMAFTGATVACRHGSSRTPEPGAPANREPRPAVIAAEEGRYLRGGTTPLLIKVDPVTTGSRRWFWARRTSRRGTRSGCTAICERTKSS
jgi:hypothetical protein